MHNGIAVDLFADSAKAVLVDTLEHFYRGC